MKRIYLLTNPSYQEMEDMSFKYAIYEEDGSYVKTIAVDHDYKKPAVAGLYAVMTLIKYIGDYSDESIEVIVNDGALIEQLQGTTMTKNKDVQKVSNLARKKIRTFNPKMNFLSVAGDYKRMLDWEEKLKREA